MKNKKTEILNLSVENIGLNISLSRKLIASGILKVENLIQYSINDLAIKTKLGPRSIQAIISTIRSLGLEFNTMEQIKFNIFEDSLIEEINLEPRIFNALNRSGIKYIKDLLSVSCEDLMKIDNISITSITKLNETLSNFGFKLSQHNNINIESSVFILNDVDFFIRRKLAYNEIRIIKDLLSLKRSDLYILFNNNVNLFNEIIHSIHNLGFVLEEEKENNFITLESSIFILDIDFSIRKKLASRGVRTIEDFSELEVNSNQLVGFDTLEKDKLSDIFIFLGNYFSCNNVSDNNKQDLKNDYTAIINCLKQHNPELVSVFENILEYGRMLEVENNKYRSTIEEITNMINFLPNSTNQDLFSKKKTKRY